MVVGSGWLKLILTHLFPSMSQEELNKIMTMRSQTQIPHVYESVLLQGNNVDFVGEGFDEGDASLAKSDIEKSKKKHTSGPPDGDAKVSASAGSASSGSGSKPRKKVSIKGGCTPAWAKEFLPSVKGTWIKFDDVRHFRWQAGYPRSKIPRSTSVTFGNGEVITQDLACIGTLEQVWEIHFEETQEECPYDFEVLE
jgi:hypothetical protein